MAALGGDNVLNLVVLESVVKELRLAIDSAGKPECRFTLVQLGPNPAGRTWQSYFPCYSVGRVAEKLADDLENGRRVVISNAKLVYKRRDTKAGEQSRMEVLVWAAEPLEI